MKLILLAQNADLQFLKDRGIVGIPGGWPIEVHAYTDGDVVPSEWQVMSDENLRFQYSNNNSAYQLFLTSQIDVVAMVAKSITAAMNFGRGLMAEFGAANVLKRLTPAQVAGVAQKLLNVQLLLMSGSLYTAISAMNAIVPDAVLTAEVIKVYRNKIEEYLGVPPT
jgi:hypothetical protein